MGKKKKASGKKSIRNNAVMRAREDAFIVEFPKTWDAEKACKAAGLKTRSLNAAHTFLRRPRVKDAIDEMLTDKMAAAKMYAEKIVAIVSGIADASLKDFASWTSDDLKFVPSSRLTRDQARAIKSIEVRRNAQGLVSHKITLHDPLKANELLARIKRLIGSDEDGSRPQARESAIMVRRALAEEEELSGGGEPPAEQKPLARKKSSVEGRP